MLAAHWAFSPSEPSEAAVRSTAALVNTSVADSGVASGSSKVNIIELIESVISLQLSASVMDGPVAQPESSARIDSAAMYLTFFESFLLSQEMVSLSKDWAIASGRSTHCRT